MMNNKFVKTTRDLGRAIRQVRKDHHFTQVELAQCTNVGVRFLSDLERGKDSCHIGKALKVAANLGIKLIMQEPRKA